MFGIACLLMHTSSTVKVILWDSPAPLCRKDQIVVLLLGCCPPKASAFFGLLVFSSLLMCWETQQTLWDIQMCSLGGAA